MMKPISIDNPTNNDILFGRDAESWNHEGNRSFRLLVAKFQDEYHSSESRVKKVAIVAKIVKELQEVGARFLKRDKRLKIWFEVDRKAAIEKVGHAIRDKQIIAQRTIQKKKQFVAGVKIRERPDSRGSESSGNSSSGSVNKKMTAKRSSRDSVRPSPTTMPNYSLLAQKKAQLLEEESHHLAASNVNSAAAASAATGLPSVIRENILFQHMMNSGRGAHSLASAAAAHHHQQQQQQRRSLALRRVEMDAAQQMSAAEDYFTSLQKRRLIEEDIAFLSRRAVLLETIKNAGAGNSGAAPHNLLGGTGGPSVLEHAARQRSASTLLDLHASLAAATSGSPAAMSAAAAQHRRPSYVPSHLSAQASALEQQLQRLGFNSASSRRSFSS